MWKKNEVTFIRFQVTTGAWFKIKNGIIFIELFAWKVEDNNIMWTWSQMEGRAGGWWNKIFIRIFGSTFYTCQLFLTYRCDIFILRVPGFFCRGPKIPEDVQRWRHSHTFIKLVMSQGSPCLNYNLATFTFQVNVQNLEATLSRGFGDSYRRTWDVLWIIQTSGYQGASRKFRKRWPGNLPTM